MPSLQELSDKVNSEIQAAIQPLYPNSIVGEPNTVIETELEELGKGGPISARTSINKEIKKYIGDHKLTEIVLDVLTKNGIKTYSNNFI